MAVGYILCDMAPRQESDGKVSTSFKIRKDLHVKLKVAAARQGRDMGELVEEALDVYLRDPRSADGIMPPLDV